MCAISGFKKISILDRKALVERHLNSPILFPERLFTKFLSNLNEKKINFKNPLVIIFLT
jgi:hypothetical protein